MQQANETTEATITVITANIHAAAGIEKFPLSGLDKSTIEKNLDVIADILSQHAPDIVLLQEVDFKAMRSGFVNQSEYLAQRLAMHEANLVTLDTWLAPAGYLRHLPKPLKKLRYGIAILSKKKIQKPSMQWILPNSEEAAQGVMYDYRNEQRGLLAIRYPISGQATLFIANTHLDFEKPQLRARQRAAIKKHLPEKGWILGGDFNEPSSTVHHKDNLEAVELCKVHGWQCDENEDTTDWMAIFNHQKPKEESPESRTYPARTPLATIDHIFSSSGIQCLSQTRIDSQSASDHHFVKAVFRVISEKR